MRGADGFVGGVSALGAGGGPVLADLRASAGLCPLCEDPCPVARVCAGRALDAAESIGQMLEAVASGAVGGVGRRCRWWWRTAPLGSGGAASARGRLSWGWRAPGCAPSWAGRYWPRSRVWWRGRWARSWRRLAQRRVGGAAALPAHRCRHGARAPGIVFRGGRAAPGVADPLGGADRLDPVSPPRHPRRGANRARAAAPWRAAPRGPGRGAEGVRLATLARARRSRRGPRSPRWTGPATSSSTSPTRRLAPAASTSPSCALWAPNPGI